MVSELDDRDTRKVRTAVLGSRDSDDPIFLPYEKEAAEQIRLEHGPDAYFCGFLLGACGKRLTLRAGDVRVPHFAHRPPVRCGRVDLVS